MSRQSIELKKQQERAKKYGCDGRCYWSTGMCPSVEICDETRVGEAIATAIGTITILAMMAMVPIIVVVRTRIRNARKAIQNAARSRATTMSKSEKYSEIILLGQMLQERKIEHEQHDLYDGYQIIVPLPEPTKEISVIEHQCSYGSIMNLLEIWADGSIQGYLSAKQTLRIIERVKARESPR